MGYTDKLQYLPVIVIYTFHSQTATFLYGLEKQSVVQILVVEGYFPLAYRDRVEAASTGYWQTISSSSVSSSLLINAKLLVTVPQLKMMADITY